MRTIEKLRRYAVTASYLQPRQIPHRLRAILRRVLLHRSRLYRSRYEKCANGEEAYSPLVFSSIRPQPIDIADIELGTFSFLNHDVAVGDPIQWFPKGEVRLWLYNLHYWHYATSLGCRYDRTGEPSTYDLFRSLVRQWIAACPVATPTAWDAYPTSLRIVNWIRAYTLFSPCLEDDAQFSAELRRSIFIQARFLESHLEYDLLNNHLLENGRALLLAGMFFDGRVAERWHTKGLKILLAGLAENFLGDGGHDEVSPMYHAAMLDLYDELACVLEDNGQQVPRILTEQLGAMRNWLAAVMHPDRKIALLNDSAFGVAPPAVDLLNGVECDDDGLGVLPKSGYFTFRDSEKQHFLIFDCGRLGPEHQPAHGHCDTLSYELSISGKRIVVDSGVGTYHGDIEWRDYFRSTRAHNTIQVDDQEQSEIWQRFRVARRAYPENPIWSDTNPELTYVAGSHTGYQRLVGRVRHRRWICWVARRFWLICDQVTGTGSHDLQSHVHFHPAATVMTRTDSESGRPHQEVQREEVSLQVLPFGEQWVSTHRGELNPIQGWYAPQFGLHEKNDVLTLHHSGKLPHWLGYVLWPEATKPNVEVFSTNDTCRISVQNDSDRYDVVIGTHDVKLKTSYADEVCQSSHPE